jgi:hypothetical protein
LEEAAKTNRRSLSAEAVARLEKSVLIEDLIRDGLVPVMLAFDQTGAQLAEERGLLSSDWLRDPEIYRFAALAAIRRLLLLSPEPWSAEDWKMILEQAFLSADNIKTGRSGFIAPDTGAANKPAQNAA